MHHEGENVITLFGDLWSGASNSEWEISAPTPAIFDSALDQLDGEARTMITICGEGAQHLAIGGGAGRYIVYATFDNEQFWNLRSNEKASGKTMLFVGGQEGDFQAEYVVTKEQARSAGHAFLKTFQLDPAQEWIKK